MFCFSLISFAASQKTSFPSSWCPALFTLFVLSKVTAEKTQSLQNPISCEYVSQRQGLEGVPSGKTARSVCPISDVNCEHLSDYQGRKEVGYTAWALCITSLSISLNPLQKIHNKRTWITAYLTNGATRLGPVGMRTRTPDPPRLRAAAVTGQALVIYAHYMSHSQMLGKFEYGLPAKF